MRGIIKKNDNEERQFSREGKENEFLGKIFFFSKTKQKRILNSYKNKTLNRYCEMKG